MMKPINLIIFILLCSFHLSCKKENVTKIINENTVLNKENLNNFSEEINGYKYTKLGLASRDNNLQEMKKLISEGADINLAKSDDIYEFDALYVAIENNHPQIVDYLLKKGANVNKYYTEEYLTPLKFAEDLRHHTISQILIKNGAKKREKEPTEKNIIPKKFWGNYSIYTELEATTTGMSSISYDFKINENGVLLETNTYHASIRCNGNYKALVKENHLALYYDGHEDGCQSNNPNFEIKINENKFFIKGVGNEEYYSQWQLLNKK